MSDLQVFVAGMGTFVCAVYVFVFVLGFLSAIFSAEK